MEYLVIGLVAFLGSGLTLFSGFGLGTVLVPVFAIFFPVDLAIALTAIVHFLNNLFKLALLGRHANRRIVLQFGVPSILAAFLGAYALTMISKAEPLYTYELGSHIYQVMPLKITIAVVLIFFALFDVVPRLARLQFDSKYLFAGGLLSGFFGGLSGNQGALRSAFLIRTNLTKEVFIATGVVIACLIDISRLAVYSGGILSFGDQLNVKLLVVATLSAFLGAYIGNKLMKKVTFKIFQYVVAIALMTFAIFLGAGII